MIIDSHAHYSHFRFQEGFRYVARENGAFVIREGRLGDVLAEMRANGIAGSVEPAIGPESNPRLLAFCRAGGGFFHPAVGVHPTRTAAVRPRDLRALRAWASDPAVVAIGETGLDYHLARREQRRLRQLLLFRYQIGLAAKRGLPLILHIRLAYRDASRILKRNRKKLNGGVAHCFCGTKEEALALTGLGFCIGVGGALLQQNETGARLREAVRAIPLERILVETDAPYVLPALPDPSLGGKTKRKLRNTSLILPEVIRAIAELKETDAATVEETVYRNTVRVFRLNDQNRGEET